MSQLQPTEFEIALQECANEPIHTPSSIQPHGYLISLCHDSRKIIRVSDNISSLFECSVSEILTHPASNFLPTSFIEEITNLAKNGPPNCSTSIPIELKKLPFNAIAHIAEEELVIELEPSSEQSVQSEQSVLFELESFCSEISACANYPALFDTLARSIRKVTGFDRVKVYQFDEDWNGLVVAEDKQNFMQTYLGLSFPASDIPKQARDLYKRNLLRQIVNSDYDPMPISSCKTVGNRMFDMSFSVLRSVSPVHLQYLKNLDVGASMSLSILKDDELWSLAVCHHSQAKFVSYKVRTLCEIMSHVFTSRLMTLSREMAQQQERELRIIIDSLLSTDSDLQRNEMLKGAEESSLKLLGADGLIIFDNNKKRTFGAIPCNEELQKISDWYQQKQNRQLYKTSDIGGVLRNSGFDSMLSGGLLVAPIGYHKHKFVCWYRAAQVSNIFWAGNPDKSAEIDTKGLLVPRNSFARWKSEVKHKSLPWEENCIGIAEYIVGVIQETEKREVEAKNLAKSDFLSHMSHELRTPLSAISSIAQILAEDAGTEADKNQLIESLKVSSRSLTALVNDLLDLNKIEAGAIELEKIKFSSEELMEEIRSVMGVEAARKGLSFNVNYGSGKQKILLGDVNKLRQVLFNLVGNALKFTPSGFINVFCTVTNSVYQTGKAQLFIDVSDTGVGIADKCIDLIFEKFTQADKSISKQYGGSGLGLSISKSLMEIMEGEISVTSKQGMGTKFSVIVELPICSDGQSGGAVRTKLLTQTADKPSEEKFNKQILLAEDYEGNVVAIFHYLQSKGFTVSIANNGKEAIEKVNSHDFDVILMDLQMPIMDGITATRQIRQNFQHKSKPNVPIIGMTASAMKEDKHRCLDAGMIDYISKPLILDELLDKIRKQL